MLGELVDAYCGGSVQALVMNIIKSERLSEDELLELKRLADAGDSTPPLRQEEPKMSLFATWLESSAALPDASIGLVLIVKWTAVLALAWLAHGMLAGRNPRWRVALWRSAIVGLALVALLSLVPPIVTYQSRSRETAFESKSRERCRASPAVDGRGAPAISDAGADRADPSRAGRCFPGRDAPPRRAGPRSSR